MTVEEIKAIPCAECGAGSGEECRDIPYTNAGVAELRKRTGKVPSITRLVDGTGVHHVRHTAWVVAEKDQPGRTAGPG